MFVEKALEGVDTDAHMFGLFCIRPPRLIALEPLELPFGQPDLGSHDRYPMQSVDIFYAPYGSVSTSLPWRFAPTKGAEKRPVVQFQSFRVQDQGSGAQPLGETNPIKSDLTCKKNRARLPPTSSSTLTIMFLSPLRYKKHALLTTDLKLSLEP